MDSISDWNGKLIALNALRLGDDEAHHQSIASTIEELLQAAHRGKNRDFGKMANNPRVHEIIEDEVIYPSAVLTGK